jgi:DNA-binding HxlR family transcriptional regulator
VARATSPRLVEEGDACAQSDASLVRAFELLGRRWTGVILGTLSDRPASFRALERAVPGISDSMLSTRLTALRNAGLLSRAVDEGPPVSVAYELTDAGRALLPALEQISRWADEYLPAGPAKPGPVVAAGPRRVARASR